MAQQAIGVFDSGLGGLSVARAIRKAYPGENLLYLGDLGALPYGTKSKKKIKELSLRNLAFLESKKVKAVVIACNSASSAAYGALKKASSVPVIDVVRPAISMALQRETKKIGVIGTSATISSEIYSKTLRKHNPKLRVIEKACPLFVSLVEEGIIAGELAERAIDHYLAPMKRVRMDVLILGCTHYPLLRHTIAKYLGGNVAIIDSSTGVVSELARQDLVGTSARGTGRMQVYVTDRCQHFERIGSRFLGQPMGAVKTIQL